MVSTPLDQRTFGLICYEVVPNIPYPALSPRLHDGVHRETSALLNFTIQCATGWTPQQVRGDNGERSFQKQSCYLNIIICNPLH